MSPEDQGNGQSVFGALEADKVDPETEDIQNQLETAKKELEQQRAKTQEFRAETNKWVIGIIIAVTAALMFTAGRMTSQWFDLNKELRALQERVAVIETIIAPELP